MKYFKEKELICKCGCGLMPPPEAIDALEFLREAWGKPLIINSAARCLDDNKRVNGKPSSPHLPAKDRKEPMYRKLGGGGFDIKMDPKDFPAFEKLALKYGFRGFGYGSNFIHIDNMIRPIITRWTY